MGRPRLHEIDDGVTLIAPTGGVTYGVPVRIGGLVCIPRTTALVGVAFAADLVGVFELASTGTITAGAPVYWTGSACSAVRSAGFPIGVAVKAAASSLVRIALGATSVGGVALHVPTTHTPEAMAGPSAASEVFFTSKPTAAAGVVGPGMSVRAGATVKVTASHTTDTANVKLYVGGILVASTTAIDVADNDVLVLNFDGKISADGASLMGVGLAQYNATPKTPTLVLSDSFDSAAVCEVKVSVTWSAVDAGNATALYDAFLDAQ